MLNKIRTWFKKRRNIFLITVPNIIFIWGIVKIITKATRIPDVSLRVTSILLLVIIFELAISNWIKLERYLGKLGE